MEKFVFLFTKDRRIIYRHDGKTLEYRDELLGSGWENRWIKSVRDGMSFEALAKDDIIVISDAEAALLM